MFCLALQADGKILVGGAFGTLGGQTRTSIGRLNADGSLDSSFNPGANGAVESLAVQADGKILVGGQFSTLGGQPRNYIGRLNNTGPATNSLSYDGSTIKWLRGGTGPEVWRTAFDFSTNVVNWVSLGAGTRIGGLPAGQAGGWQLTNTSLPSTTGTIRARGFVSGGADNASGWFVEGYWGGLAVVIQPSSRTNDAGSASSFTVVAGGAGPLGYQWLKNGVPLADGGHVSGTLTPTLTLSDVLRPDAAQYAVVITDASGGVTSAVATLTVNDPAIWTQPASQIRQAGQSPTLSVTAVGTEPLKYQWWKDGVVLPWATASGLTLTNLQGADAGNYWVVVSNVYGSVTSAVDLLEVNLATLDSSFNPGANGAVEALAVQADGKILVGGDFTTLRGQTRDYIGRLNADGSLDHSFNPRAGASAYVASVSSLAVQADGKILAGGAFTTLRRQPRNWIGRLNADGSLDSSFNPGADDGLVPGVNSLAVQADGKILVGGDFLTLAGQTRNYIGRLNADGSVDTSFNPGLRGIYNTHSGITNGFVNCIAVQADGKILVGGYFAGLDGQANCLGRLNANGSLDSSFNPGANAEAFSLAVQADGKILVGGAFDTLGGQTRNCLGRLNADGSLDSSFNPGASSYVYSLAVQADGKILVGGDFSTLGGQTRDYIGRLNADGSLDSSFNPGAGGLVANSHPFVYSLAVQADGKILVGGGFTTLGGQTRNNIGRLNNTGPATQSLSYDGSTIKWLRGGTGPEVWRTTFDFSTNAVNWVSLGAGTRIGGLPAGQAGGWQLTNTSLPSTKGTIRARGFVTGGEYNGSAWFVESGLSVVVPPSPPVILTRDGHFGFGTKGFGFNISAAAGRTIVVEASTNLLNWAPLATNLMGSGPFYFTDTATGAFPARFCRARLGP